MPWVSKRNDYSTSSHHCSDSAKRAFLTDELGLANQSPSLGSIVVDSKLYLEQAMSSEPTESRVICLESVETSSVLEQVKHPTEHEMAGHGKECTP